MLVHPDLIKAYGHYCTDSAYIAHFLAVFLVTRVVRAEALGDLVVEAARVLLDARPRAVDLGLSAFFAGVAFLAGLAALAGVAAFAGVATLEAVLTTAVGVAARTLVGLRDLEAARFGETTAFTDSTAFLAAALLGLVPAFLEGVVAATSFTAFFFGATAFLGFSTSSTSTGATGAAFLAGAALGRDMRSRTTSDLCKYERRGKVQRIILQVSHSQPNRNNQNDNSTRDSSKIVHILGIFLPCVLDDGINPGHKFPSCMK